MSGANRLALSLCLLAAVVSWIVADRVFERIAHLEDEIAYVWQAQVISRGQLSIASPPVAKSFLIPFVVDFEGQRFGKYPPGWPAMLAIGVFFKLRSLVNPLLAALGIWLTYRLGSRLFGSTVGLLAALLTLISPFFLLNSGSLLSHPFGLVLSTGFALSWLDAWEDEQPWRWLPAMTAAACLGMLALTRPLTAVGVGLPFGIHGLILFLGKPWGVKRRMLVFVVLAAGLAGILFAWQFAVTGDPFYNPYTLWWEYDVIGFGPGAGRLKAGHTLNQAWINTRYSLWVGWHDLFGWGSYSWILLPFGIFSIFRQRNWRAVLIGSTFPSLVLLYMAYWIGSWLFGPRYYYEGLFSLSIFSAVGAAFLAGWPTQPEEPWMQHTGKRRFRPLIITAILAFLLVITVIFYLPPRLMGMQGLYGISRSRMEPFQIAQAQGLTPALVIVHENRWTDYGTLLELQDAYLTTPFIFVIDRGTNANQAVAEQFPERRVFHYYPDKPFVLYGSPRQP